MAKPRWGGAEEDNIPWRQWIRDELPPGTKGFVYEDLDGIPRTFHYIKNPVGKFKLVEMKLNFRDLDVSQKRTFGLIDLLLRLADLEGTRYIGFYLFQPEDNKPENSTFVKINGKKLSLHMFRLWLLDDIYIEQYQFPDYMFAEEKERLLTLNKMRWFNLFNFFIK